MYFKYLKNFPIGTLHKALYIPGSQLLLKKKERERKRKKKKLGEHKEGIRNKSVILLYVFISQMSLSKNKTK